MCKKKKKIINNLYKACKGLHLNRCVLIQMYFEDNPRDLQLLRHDKDLHPAIIKPHMKNVPEYLSKTLLILIVFGWTVEIEVIRDGKTLCS